MGYMRHHTIVVTSWDEKILATAHAEAYRIFDATVSEIVLSPVNGYVSFFVAPDGSKEGWDSSDTGDAKRAEFIAWLRTQVYEDGSSSLTWFEAFYGDDDRECAVEHHNWDADAPAPEGGDDA